MPISAATLRALMAAGVTGDALVTVVEAIDADMALPEVVQKSAGAARQARYRERHSNVTRNVTNVTPPLPSLPLSSSPPIPPNNYPLPNPAPQPPISSNDDIAPKPKTAETLDEAFGRFKAAYPRRKGSNPWKPARDKFVKALKGGAEVESIISGASRYSAECKELGQSDSEFVTQAVTWLNQRRWEDYQAKAPGEAATGPPKPPAPGLPSDEELRRKYANDHRSDDSEDRPLGDEGILPQGPELARRLFGGISSDSHQARYGGMVELGKVLPLPWARAGANEAGPVEAERDDDYADPLAGVVRYGLRGSAG